eukprot:gnl/TRDRNA2_/TRDRNA2_187547_c0_seq1.p1 gnl/TRDRNA2_/TRDRNA2_187547_c0~~gnl/TRDRNA2_/TRDRNA2_187547_c0_seq1.p1  ORF type:complete len:206 (-),score=28.87 gnl/TRDRNA2_/TRDRNA2_187547_c0_seq1:50-667(-)
MEIATGKSWFYLNCILEHEEKHRHGKHAAAQISRKYGASELLSGTLLNAATMLGGKILGEETIVTQMVDTLEKVILDCLQEKGYSGIPAYLPLPPLQYGFPPNTLWTGEKLLAFRVKVHERQTVNKDGWFYLPTFLCCQVTADSLTPLSVDCRQLSRTLPPDVMRELQTKHRIYVRCEGCTIEEQSRFLASVGLPGWTSSGLASC